MTETDSPTERRISQRIHFETPAALYVDGRWHACVTANISVTGILVAIDLRHVEGRAATLRFQLPGASEEVELEAVFVRRRPIDTRTEWALQFQSIPLEVWQFVAEQLRTNPAPARDERPVAPATPSAPPAETDSFQNTDELESLFRAALESVA